MPRLSSSLVSVETCHKAKLLSVKEGVKVLPPNISGVIGTDAMETYLTGRVDRPAASGARITTAGAPTFTTTYLHLHNHH